MTARVAVYGILAVALLGCGGQRAPATAHHLPTDVATPPATPGLLRISHAAGTAQLFDATTLAPRQLLIPGGLPTIARVLGTSGTEDQSVFVVDNSGRLVTIDLQARRSRVAASSAREFVASPDGVIIGVDSAHHPVRFANRQVTVFKASVDHGATVMRGPGDQIVVVGSRAGTLQLYSAAADAHHSTLPAGRISSTWSGDLVAVATDSGVTLIDPTGKLPTRSVRIRGTPTVSAFSPSGHRLYVGRKQGGLVVVDRFLVMVDRSRRQQVKELNLAGPTDRIRVDRTGRWLLAHQIGSDSISIIDLPAASQIGEVAAPWADDLPQIVDGKTLIVRRKNDVVSYDVSTGSPTTQRAILAGGAGDLYVMLPWAPRGQNTAPNNIAAVTAPTSRDSAPAPARGTPTTPVAAPAQGPGVVVLVPAPAKANADTAAKLYIQVSSSQNSEWAQTFAKQLKDGGFAARVLDPKTSDEGYRVVIGPFHTRDEADAVGKRLGRSYFILTPGSGDT